MNSIMLKMHSMSYGGILLFYDLFSLVNDKSMF